MTYLEVTDEALLRISEDDMDVARHSDARGDVDAGVEHPEERLKLRILDDLEGAMVACDPEGELDAEPGRTVRHSRSELSHGALLRGAVRSGIALFHMPFHVPGGRVMNLAIVKLCIVAANVMSVEWRSHRRLTYKQQVKQWNILPSSSTTI